MQNVLKSLDGDVERLVGLDRISSTDKAAVQAAFSSISAASAPREPSAARKKKIKRTEDWCPSSSEEEEEEDASNGQAPRAQTAPGHEGGDPDAMRAARAAKKKKQKRNQTKTPVTGP